LLALLEFKPYFYDLLLVDINMPSMTGYELVEKIVKLDLNIKIVKGNDIQIVGREGDDRLFGDLGNDVLEGDGGADYFDCGEGIDIVADNCETT
jgi:Ca2+-binding RTX toxin-like protein